MNTPLHLFTKRYPAFFYGLFFYLGCHFAYVTYWSLFPALLFLFFVEKKHVFLLTLTFLFPLPLIFNQYTFPPTHSTVEGNFYIQKIAENSRFSKGWTYQGFLKTAQSKRIICRIYHKEKLDGNRVYKVNGILKEKEKGHYTLKLANPIVPLSQRNFSLAEIRLTAKQIFKDYIQNHIAQERAANFLAALTIGEFDDRMLANEFSNLGLSHIMAISGFHFGLIAFFFHVVLRLFFSYKVNAAILIALLTLYFLFLGNSPSVFRSWVFCVVLLLGQVLEKKSTSINTLGVASLVTLFFNPFSAGSLSFQLSFLATAGILFFYGPMDKTFQRWLPKLALKQVIKKNVSEQLWYIVSGFFRDVFALTVAVHLPLAPVLFFAFHSFPLNSLFYNLFFPFLTAIAMCLFFLSCLLGNWLHWLNGHFTEWILTITESPPVQFKTVYTDFPVWALTLYLTLLVFAAIRVNVGKVDSKEMLFKKSI